MLRCETGLWLSQAKAGGRYGEGRAKMRGPMSKPMRLTTDAQVSTWDGMSECHVKGGTEQCLAEEWQARDRAEKEERESGRTGRVTSWE